MQPHVWAKTGLDRRAQPFHAIIVQRDQSLSGALKNQKILRALEGNLVSSILKVERLV